MALATTKNDSILLKLTLKETKFRRARFLMVTTLSDDAARFTFKLVSTENIL